MAENSIETGYLVIGAGAMGRACADALLGESNAEVVLVDRHHRPGGHWNDAYPFVRLHQASACYGVASLPLGGDTKGAHGLNRGPYEVATGAELCGYFDQVMQQKLLPTGRCRYFPSSNYPATEDSCSACLTPSTRSRRGRPSSTRPTRTPTCRRRTNPCTAWRRESAAPPNELVHLAAPPSAYVVIGAGKTAIDTCLWLLENGVDPQVIRWIKPREPWLNDRRFFQPGDLVAGTAEGIALVMEAVASSESVEDVFARLNAAGALLRIDESVAPTAYRCATVTRAELAELRRIERVVRLGRVQRIDRDEIVLERGKIPTDPGCLHVDCTTNVAPSSGRRAYGLQCDVGRPHTFCGTYEGGRDPDSRLRR